MTLFWVTILWKAYMLLPLTHTSVLCFRVSLFIYRMRRWTKWPLDLKGHFKKLRPTGSYCGWGRGSGPSPSPTGSSAFLPLKGEEWNRNCECLPWVSCTLEWSDGSITPEGKARAGPSPGWRRWEMCRRRKWWHIHILDALVTFLSPQLNTWQEQLRCSTKYIYCILINYNFTSQAWM